MSGADGRKSSRKQFVVLPVTAAALGAVYMLGLHPASGAGGGMLFLLVGWAAPSLLPLLLALWVALSCRRRLVLRLGVFAIVLVLASANTRLPDLAGQAFAHKDSDWQVERRVERRERYDVVQVGSTDDLALAAPALPWVTWHGSERCMCLYLGHNDDALYTGELSAFLGDSALMNAAEGRGLHLSYEVTPAPDRRHGTITLQFRDQHGIAATFRQRGLPLIPAPQDLGGDGLAGANVATHGMDLLLHDNIVLTQLSSRLPSLFDRQSFAAFMDAATVAAK